MKKLIKVKTKRSRPATGGRDPFVGIRLPAETIARVDAWAKNVAAKSRSEAICRLVEIGLGASLVEIGLGASVVEIGLRAKR
jgi:hypothetical protein